VENSPAVAKPVENVKNVQPKDTPKVIDAATEAQLKAAQQRAEMPLEERVQQFRTLLSEKEVTHLHMSFFPDVLKRSFTCSGECIFHLGEGVAEDRVRSTIFVVDERWTQESVTL